MDEKMTIRTVRVDSGSISYEFRRKKVKNINLRVRSDGSVAVSASSRVPLAAVDSFVRSRAELILQAQHRFSQKKETPPPRQFVTGETVWYLGEALRLEVREGRPSLGEIQNGRLLLTVPAGADAGGRERAFYRFWAQQCLQVFGRALERQYPLFQSMGVRVPTLKVRSMRSRWGSCHVSKGIITLSYQLLERPLAAVEYVVLHEYCHFIHPNHSQAFHSLVESLMPDWRQRKKLFSAALPDVPGAVQQ